MLATRQLRQLVGAEGVFDVLQAQEPALRRQVDGDDVGAAVGAASGWSRQ